MGTNIDLKEIWLMEMIPVDHQDFEEGMNDPNSENYEPYDHENTDHYILYCPYCRSNEPLALIGDTMVCKTCRSEWIASPEDRSNIGRAELEKYGKTDNPPFEIIPHDGDSIQASNERDAYEFFKNIVVDELKEFIDNRKKKFSDADSALSSYLGRKDTNIPRVFEDSEDEITQRFIERFKQEWEDELKEEFEKENMWSFYQSDIDY